MSGPVNDCPERLSVGQIGPARESRNGLQLCINTTGLTLVSRTRAQYECSGLREHFQALPIKAEALEERKSD